MSSCRLSFNISSTVNIVEACTVNDNKVEISWNNPLGVEIDYFVIERSKKGYLFKEIIKIETGKNKSSSIEYFEVDYKPFNKKAYYRIKQVSINGVSHYSNIVVAENFGNIKPLFSLFSKNQNRFNLKSYSATNILVVLLDINKNEYTSNYLCNSLFGFLLRKK